MALASIACSISTLCIAQSNLPDDVRADILRAQIIKDAQPNKKGRLDYAAILEAIDEYKKLDVEMPPPLLLVEAKAAHAISDPVRAIEALEAFMVAADRKSPEYQKAIQIYPDYQTASQPARQLLHDKIVAQPLECKDPGNLLSGTNQAWAQYSNSSVIVLPAVAEARTQVSLVWKVYLRYGYQEGSLTVSGDDGAAARITLVPNIPFTPAQTFPLGTLRMSKDVRFAKEQAIDLNLSKTSRNPPPGKYCVIVEGMDTDDPSPFMKYAVLKDPLVILP